jgi:glycosyltransferase involved in cell wall biosynthesis
VRVFHQENQGLSHTLNRAIREARTPYVARIDQDDINLPNRFMRQYQYLVDHPEVDGVFSLYHKRGKARSWDNRDKFRQAYSERGARPYNPIKDGVILHTTMMFKRDVLLDIGGYRQAFYPSDDHDLSLRLSEKAAMHVLLEPLVIYRFHAGANTYKGFGEMCRRSRWALDCFHKRSAGLSELRFEDFMATFSRKQRLNFWRIDSARYYIRVAGQHYLDNAYFKMILPLALNMALNPQDVYRRLRTMANTHLAKLSLSYRKSRQSSALS